MKQMRLRYILGLLLIACVSILGHVTFSQALSKNTIEGRRINVAGRQRMLSQRILAKAHLTMNAKGEMRQNALSDLKSAVSLFESSHDALLYGNAKIKLEQGAPPEILEMYKREGGVDSKSKKYIASARAWIERVEKGNEVGMVDALESLLLQEEGLLPLLNEVTMRFETNSDDHLQALENLSLALLIAVFVLLGLEIFVVFEPMREVLKRQFEKLSQNSELLEARHDEVSRIMEQTGDAMMTISIQGTSGSFCSMTTYEWFGEWDDEKPFWTYVAADDDVQSQNIQKMFFEFMCNNKQECSRTFFLQGRYIDMTLCSLDGSINDALVIMSDMTDSRRQRAAEEASQAKSTFLANMSHELRTPLNAVIGYTEILEEEEFVEEEEGKEILTHITKAGQHLLGLIGNILDLTKLEAGQMMVKKEVFCLDHMIKEVTQTIHPMMRTNNNTLTQTTDLEELDMLSDAKKVKQILLNLLSNAAKFTVDGQVHLTSSEEVRAGGERWIIFKVSDTGSGMPEEVLEHIFDAFIQADNSHTRAQDGTGLGLAICQRFAMLLGGEIYVESTLGQGSTFTLELPGLIQDDLKATIPPGSNLISLYANA